MWWLVLLYTYFGGRDVKRIQKRCTRRWIVSNASHRYLAIIARAFDRSCCSLVFQILYNGFLRSSQQYYRRVPLIVKVQLVEKQYLVGTTYIHFYVINMVGGEWELAGVLLETRNIRPIDGRS
jgi:hypothetical protein